MIQAGTGALRKPFSTLEKRVLAIKLLLGLMEGLMLCDGSSVLWLTHNPRYRGIMVRDA